MGKQKGEKAVFTEQEESPNMGKQKGEKFIFAEQSESVRI